MKLASPATARHRFRVECFKAGTLEYSFASSAAGQHTFEVEDHIDAVRYTVDETSWVWDGENWLQGQAAEKALKPKNPNRKVKPRGPKKRIADLNDAPGPIVPDDIDPDLYKAAEEYAKAFAERQAAVKKSFRKVTKKL